MIEDKELLEEFIIDAKAHTETIETGLLRVEQGNQDEASLNEVFRAAHSIKGTAGFFGLEKIVELSHAMESLLGKMRKKEIAANPAVIDALLSANDRLKELLFSVFEDKPHEIADCVLTLQQFEQQAMLVGSYKQDKSQDAIECKENVEEQATAKQGMPSFLPQLSSVKAQYGDTIKTMCKQGRKFYCLEISVPVKNTAADKICGPMGKNIQSIGTLLTYYIRLEQGKPGEAAAAALFLFSTVLEKELVVMALGTVPAAIRQLDVHKEENEIFQMLLAAEGDVAKELVLPVTAAVEPVNVSVEKNDLSSPSEERIKVDVLLLNQLVNLSSEMVLARNQLLRAMLPYSDQLASLQPILQKLDHTISEMQERIMRTRMQPIATLLHSMPRLVRELGKKLGKQVLLEVQGEQVELDKSIIEGLVDPFTHLVRNALDHGIETPAVRQSSAKPPLGILTIKAYHEGGRVMIDMKDDGAGISSEKVRQRALQQALISQEQAEILSQAELLKLIFLPGFSTVQKISNISGRGVGLDVVRSNIERLGGMVEVDSTVGQGTTFRLILPLTLAIIPSLILGVADYLFALPQVNLQEVVRVKEADFKKMESIGNCRLFRLRGELVPVIDLAAVIGMPAAEMQRVPMTKILILKSAVSIFGLRIDLMQDREEVLIKPLPNYLKRKRIYSGVTILGDGKIAMVLDVEGISEVYHLATAIDRIPPSHKMKRERVVQESSQEVLLFHCSGPEILALPLKAITRIEEISIGRIAKIGGQEFYHSQGLVWQLIRPESFLPVPISVEKEQKNYAIILKNSPFPAAILAEKIDDTVSVFLTQVKPKETGIFNSFIVEEKIAFLIALPELFQVMTTQRAVTGSDQFDLKETMFCEQQTVQPTGRILTFYLDAALYGIDLSYAREINRVGEYTEISGEMAGIAGLLNLRGQVVTLFDVLFLLNDQSRSAVRRKHCIILKGNLLENTGFFIDRLGDVIDITSDMCESLPVQSDNPAEYAVTQAIKLPEQVVLMLDVKRLFEHVSQVAH